MAIRRGAHDLLGVDMVTITGSASLVEAPCFVYSIWASVIDGSATGAVSLADSSASGDADAEAEKIEIKLGQVGNSASSQPYTQSFKRPIYISKTLVASVTNAHVGVTYIAA